MSACRSTSRQTSMAPAARRPLRPSSRARKARRCRGRRCGRAACRRASSSSIPDARGGEGEDFIRQRPGIAVPLRSADAADEIHQHQIGAAPADLQAEGIDAIGIDMHRDRRLADTAAHRFPARQQPFLFQHPHDDGDGLRRQPAAARDIGLRQRAVETHQRQHEPFVIGSHPDLVRTPAGFQNWWRDRRVFRLHPRSTWPLLPIVGLCPNSMSMPHRINNSIGFIY